MSAARPLRLVPGDQPVVTDTVTALCRRACTDFRVEWDDMFGSSRKARVVKARTWVALQLRRLEYTVSEIGELFDRDHTTVCYWLGKAKR